MKIKGTHFFSITGNVFKHQLNTTMATSQLHSQISQLLSLSFFLKSTIFSESQWSEWSFEWTFYCIDAILTSHLNCSNTWGQKRKFFGESFLTSWQVFGYLYELIKAHMKLEREQLIALSQIIPLMDMTPQQMLKQRLTFLCERSILNTPYSSTIQYCLQTYSAAERNAPHALCWNRMKCCIGKAMVFFSLGSEGCTGSKRPLWQKVNGCTQVSLTILQHNVPQRAKPNYSSESLKDAVKLPVGYYAFNV